jgi:hypothetical protein
MYKEHKWKELHLYQDSLFEVEKLKYGGAISRINEILDNETINEHIENYTAIKEIEPGPDIETIRCPFTNIVVYDQEGHHEPYPDTLIAINLLDELYFHHGFEILAEYYRKTEEERDVIMECFEEDQRNVNYLYQKIPWFDWSEIFDGYFRVDSFLELHKLIQRREDTTFYNHPFAEGPYYFYFAKPELHSLILSDIKTVAETIVEFVTLKLK